MKPARSRIRLLAAGLLLSDPVGAAMRVRPVRSQPQPAVSRVLPRPESQRPIRLSGHEFRGSGPAAGAVSPQSLALEPLLIQPAVPLGRKAPEPRAPPPADGSAARPAPRERPLGLPARGAPKAAARRGPLPEEPAVPAIGGRTGVDVRGVEQAGRAAEASLASGDAAAAALSFARGFDGGGVEPSLPEVSVAFRIPAHSAGDGFGDAMAALALARNFKGLHPASAVKLVLESASHQEKFKFLHPKVPSPGGVAGGVEIELPAVAADPLAGWPWLPPTRTDVSINRIAAGYFAGFGQEPVNIYVGEPGGRESTPLPEGYEYGKAYFDGDGNVHIFLPAGLNEQEVGLAIDEALAGRPSVERAREPLLAELRELHPSLSLSPLRRGERWGFVYLHENEEYSRPWGRMYLDILREAADEGRFAGERVRIFDFSASRWEPVYAVSAWRSLLIRLLWPLRFLIRRLPAGLRGYLGWPAFTHVCSEGSVFPGEGHPNVEIVHIGNVPHDLLVRFLQEADLPVVVTGTRSLEEAISLRKRFFYQVVPWKEDLFNGLLARALLELPEEDALRLASLLGVSNWVGLRKVSATDLYSRLRLIKEIPRSMALTRSHGKALLTDPATQASFDAFLDVLHSVPRAGEGLGDAMRQAFAMRRQQGKAAVPALP